MKNESIVQIKYTNYRSISEVLYVISNNETTIIVKPPSFFLTNIESNLMKIQIEISFDNGNYFKSTNLTVNLLPIQIISIEPLLLPQNIHFSIQLNNLPLIHFNNVSLKLISNLNSISLNCDSSFKICNSTNENEIKPGIYELKIFINSDISNILSTKLKIYSK